MLCPTCNREFDNTQCPGFIFFTSNLQFFIDFERQDYERRSNWARDGYDTPTRACPSAEQYESDAIKRSDEQQPAESDKLAPRLADMHARSQPPTGKFGFHVQTYHRKIAQAVNKWDDSWCAMFSRHLGYVMELAERYLK
ncbi:uncharacterized protein PV09_09373 [Verruconis gallopava]|uniref:Uncharacterized protein n=1 Tax=Verruconis gallopava TaxID=253628 RepID=A0A0D2AIW8_9PEZI|nr:uncharacterized protein PV09_09373 [Verruconis gallopava]KIV98883.1 hypothetical protein PV09_09373 [Verruconis gallopava]